MAEKWIEVSIAVPEKFVSIVDNNLKSFGSLGNVTECFLTDEKKEPSLIDVKGYFSGTVESNRSSIEALDSFLLSLKELFPLEINEDLQINETSKEEWQKWKDYFKPAKVSERVVIKPSWEAYQPSGDEVIIEIDPGMAFGTGTHETTKLCIQLLDQIIKGNEKVLDVGTGSGILSIAAVKLGAKEVFAIDIDDESLRVATENIHKNGAADSIAISSLSIENIKESYNIIVANILAEDLIEMKSFLINHLASGAYLILSGILVTKAEKVIDAFSKEGVELSDHIREGEWSALLFKS